ncbi:hypothetical protein SDC9_143205 [bioreactor metagenome]|uniref:Uncharacterized protein n=1 Tax=bioreactor metagenome TaxID=1076179 RepID=A0A645E3D8_9ZZZZ
MLGGGQNGTAVLHPLALITADEGSSELTDQKRILAKGLIHAAPTQIAGQAEHGRKGPVDAGGYHFLSGDAADAL